MKGFIKMGTVIITYRFNSDNTDYQQRRKDFINSITDKSNIIEDFSDENSTTSTIICKPNLPYNDFVEYLNQLNYHSEDKALFICLAWNDEAFSVYRLKDKSIQLDSDLLSKLLGFL